jgi:hypothetical protein
MNQYRQSDQKSVLLGNTRLRIVQDKALQLEPIPLCFGQSNVNICNHFVTAVPITRQLYIEVLSSSSFSPRVCQVMRPKDSGVRKSMVGTEAPWHNCSNAQSESPPSWLQSMNTPFCVVINYGLWLSFRLWYCKWKINYLRYYHIPSVNNFCNIYVGIINICRVFGLLPKLSHLCSDGSQA